jgi:hypothetical protein
VCRSYVSRRYLRGQRLFTASGGLRMFVCCRAATIWLRKWSRCTRRASAPLAAVVSILRSKPHPQASQTARPVTNTVHSHLGICRRAIAQERQGMDDELTAIDRPDGSVAAFPHRLPTAHIVACTLSRSSSTQILCSFIQSGLVQRQAQLPPETAPSADK